METTVLAVYNELAYDKFHLARTKKNNLPAKLVLSL